mmetsp:Transcript_34632/g.47997  ORF Transcript_34632/g.47997 Transcript_34632/m.47997 type:complete len:454 (+) Transcript_34632:226-1587(+)|eukprot:CAMPEP_0196590212 /NCGR_PEP_ID=MMETSP1081-20130531/65976_1 /TAXON_ID=36882 /ORGANISM="Pyramimonas amylifera, Strain CCMP720" /LENGTH=453 /DNA_ID=CAMNT_0041913251 /DNA_START=219 /DNA_END=1580 /DNA_ORIENTATION=+
MGDEAGGGTFSKGVMLCDRPTTIVKEAPRAVENDAAPFRAGRPTGSLDPLGLQPPAKVEIKTGCAHASKLNALTHHKKWIRDFSKMQSEVREHAHEGADLEAAFQERFKDYNSNLRKCILTSTEPTMHPGVRHVVEARERAEEWGTTQFLEGFCGADGGKAAPENSNLTKEDMSDPSLDLLRPGLPASLDMDMDSFVNHLLKDAKVQNPDAVPEFLGEDPDTLLHVASPSSQELPIADDSDQPLPAILPEVMKPRTAGKKKGGKPAWALSEEQAEEIEVEEEEELLNFIDNLNYDTYIADCEDTDLKEAWRLMKEAEDEEARGVDLTTKDDSWKARFVQAMNNLAGRDALEGGKDSRGGAASVGSVRSVAESAADRARARVDELRSNKGDGDQWDSTQGGDPGEKMQKLEKLAAAQALLSEDPLLRSTHSTKSVMQLLEKVQPGHIPLQSVEE